MKQSEIFYFDVDGTLLDNTTHTVPKSTLEALHALKNKGYKVALCTGRSLEGIIEAEVDTLIDWDGFVLANGSLVLDKNQNLLYESKFDPELVRAIDAAVSGPLLLEGDETFITKPVNEQLAASIKHFGNKNPLPVKTYGDEKIYNMICYNYDEITEPLLDRIQKTCITMHDQLKNMEIICNDSGKHNGTKILNKHYNITRFTGFGDGENDVEFLKQATHSVAMGNGVDNVKRVSTYTTDEVNQNGIYNALKHFEVL